MEELTKLQVVFQVKLIYLEIRQICWLFLLNVIWLYVRGGALYELNALKVPTIAISSIEHEAQTIKVFKEKGMILGGLNKWDECDFLKQFEYAEAQVKSYHLRYSSD
jgi:spore coat polysaccharide biosynthesis predicted glycosyltransferase SpsG